MMTTGFFNKEWELCKAFVLALNLCWTLVIKLTETFGVCEAGRSGRILCKVMPTDKKKYEEHNFKLL